LLNTLSLTVTVVGSGQHALAQVQQQTFALVLMDVSMPGMDGYETTRRIRCFKSSAELPIIALTAHALAGERERCLAAGMNDFLVKPFEMKDLQTIMVTSHYPQVNKEKIS
jgi:CheY-like chemotaxis protein